MTRAHPEQALAATEFQGQGLELDWVCLTWDGDLRFTDTDWRYHDFRGHRWMVVRNQANARYLLNAYRVLRPTAHVLGRAINPYLLPPAEFREKRRRGHHFVSRVLAGPKVVLIGDARNAESAH